MKFITSIYTNEELIYLKDELEVALLLSERYSLNHKDLNLDSAVSFCKENHIEIAIGLDKMFTSKDISLTEECYRLYMDKADYFYITDLGAANVALRLGIGSKIIFDPKTMVCNSKDLEIYASYGFKAVGISSEIKISDALRMKEKTNADIFLQGFGYRIMFYSRRHLISLYGNKNGTEYKKEDVFFQESTRKDYFPGFENENGTCMYRGYVLDLNEHLEKISSFSFCFMESYRISLPIMKDVLRMYKDRRDGKLSYPDSISIWESFHLHREDGFLYKDSVYEKGELKSEQI